MTNKIPSVFGMTLKELENISLKGGQKAFTAKQLALWIYKHNAQSWDDMTNLSLSFRNYLKENFQLCKTPPSKVDISSDGTKKYLFDYQGQSIETAMIPDDDRTSVCVSSQAGCRYGCRFCATGTMGFIGNLSAGEILNQLFSIEEFEKITNVVYMGMGEPMDNIEEVLKSIEILTAPWGMAWSPSRITVSTIGLVSGLQRFLSSCSANLALSLHSPFDEERKWLMPVQNIYPLAEVVDTLKDFSFTKHHRLTIEYILFHQVNDSIQHAQKLAKIANQLNARVNLIHFHAHPDSTLKGVDRGEMIRFQNQLINQGINATIRKSKGFDISAACGLLALKNNNK